MEIHIAGNRQTLFLFAAGAVACVPGEADAGMTNASTGGRMASGALFGSRDCYHRRDGLFQARGEGVHAFFERRGTVREKVSRRAALIGEQERAIVNAIAADEVRCFANELA